MRMFLIGMCDIFLILYLTSITSVKPASILTVDDFYKLKSMHATLKEDTEKRDKELNDKLRQAAEEKARLLAEKQKQEELAAAKLAEEQKKLQEMEQTLSLSDVARERVNQDLQKKEQLLNELNKEIASKEARQREMEASFQKELANKKQAIENSQQLVKQLTDKAGNAEQLANQLKEEVARAYKTAETAKGVQQKAVVLKEEALKAKAQAQQEAAQALAARQKAEAERVAALEAAKAAEAEKIKAKEEAQKLAATIKEINQDGETAYNTNIRPQIQYVNATYTRKVANKTNVYKRTLTLLPVEIDGKAYVIFPSRQIGFNSRSDRAPDQLEIVYQDKKVESVLINKDNDLIAISLPDYKKETYAPYQSDAPITELMPNLLALRNNGNVSFSDKVRGVSDDYFIVNRDFLELDSEGSLKYAVKGFRGTGTRGERIVRGDQLVDLNGRLIGIANNTNSVIRVNTVSQWAGIDFK